MKIAEYTPPIEIHNNLNPKIWNNETLRKDVQLALLKIAKEFYRFLEIDVKIIDIRVTGSQANYNYTQHSDLDLHLIVDYSTVSCDMPVSELFDTKRRLWKEYHTIAVNSIPVELYVEDSNRPAVSSTYSVLKDIWISKPSIPNTDYQEDEIKRIVSIWERVINGAIAADSLILLTHVKDLLGQYRRTGLDRSGEYGVPNLVFKSLRNDGMISKLMEKVGELKDRQLSL
jgi:hypothetical protein